MDDQEKIIITGQRQRRASAQDDHVLHKENTGMFVEKMASVIGPSYTMAFFVGGALGLA